VNEAYTLRGHGFAKRSHMTDFMPAPHACVKAEGPEVIPASESDQDSNLCGFHLAFPSHPQSQHRRPSPLGIPSVMTPLRRLPARQGGNANSAEP